MRIITPTEIERVAWEGYLEPLVRQANLAFLAVECVNDFETTPTRI